MTRISTTATARTTVKLLPRDAAALPSNFNGGGGDEDEDFVSGLDDSVDGGGGVGGGCQSPATPLPRTPPAPVRASDNTMRTLRRRPPACARAHQAQAGLPTCEWYASLDWRHGPPGDGPFRTACQSSVPVCNCAIIWLTMPGPNSSTFTRRRTASRTSSLSQTASLEMSWNASPPSLPSSPGQCGGTPPLSRRAVFDRRLCAEVQTRDIHVPPGRLEVKEAPPAEPVSSASPAST